MKRVDAEHVALLGIAALALAVVCFSLAAVGAPVWVQGIIGCGLAARWGWLIAGGGAR